MVNDNDIVQWAYLLDPAFQIVNTAGKPLTEGYIEVYYQGTRDKYYCASDFDGTLLPFQIPLDSLGSNIVLANPDNSYDIYIYNKFGSLIMSRYNVKPGHGAGGSGGLTTITSSDGTVQIDRTGNTYDLSIQDTIDRIDELEEAISSVSGVTDYSVATGYGDGGTFVLTDKDTKDITYLNDMSGWRLQPGKVYQLNFNTKFTLDDQYNNLVEGKLYLDGNMSFSQDWSFTLDDSFDHIHHINGSTIIVVPDSLQYYDLALKYTFNSIVNCSVDLENISIVDITSIVKDPSAGEYSAGAGININGHVISVDMDYINEQINIDEKLSSAVNIANDYTDNSINEVISTINNVSGDIINYVDNSIGDVVDVIASATATLEQEIQDIPPQVQSDWEQDDSTQVDYIKNKPEEIELIAGQNIGLFEGNGTLTISASATDLSDYATHSEIYSATTSAINSANSYTDTAISNIDFSDYSTHNEVYSATSTAIASANSYTDTAIANIDLTPAVEIVSPNNTISVSSVTDSANNTKTFYIDTNNPDTNYWIGEANLTLSDQSSQGVVGYYKDVFDYTTKLNGNLDATKLKKGLYLLTANVMIVADEVNNDLAEIQIQSNSTSAISFTSSVFQHDCSVADTLGEPMDESHQIATIVRVVYDDTPMSLIARMDDPTTVSNELHLWFSDIGLYELNGTSVGGGSSPSASGSYDAGWGIVINGNVISVNPNIIPDVSNLASTAYVDNRIASAVNIIESEIPDVSDMATQTWVNNQGFLKSQVQSDWTEYNSSDPAYIKNKPLEANLVAGNNITISASGNNIVISSTASAASGITYRAGTGIDINGDVISVDNTVAMKTDIPDVSNFATDTEVANAIATAVSAIPSQVQSDWTEDDTTDPSYIQNKPETIDVDVCPIIAGNGISITASGDSAVLSCTVTGSGGESYSAGNGIDITNNTISIDNTVALKSEIPDVTGFATVELVSAVSGKLPTTETGKFIIQNNVSGGPIEVVCPTDVGMPVTKTILDSNAISGIVGSGTSNVQIVYKSPGYDNDYWNYSNNQIILTVPEDVTGIYSIYAYYSSNSNPLSSNAPYFISNYVVPDTQYYKLAAGNYTINTQANQASSGYGKYITFILAGPNPDATAFAKATIKGIERHPELGISVDLDRYYLGNTNTTTSNSGIQPLIYTDPTTKKQSVFLPSSMPSDWFNSIVQYVEYGNNSFNPSYTISKQYIAYKSTTNPTRYQYAFCTDYDRTNKKMTFISYNKGGEAIEKWAVNYSTYGSYVWTTTPISSGSTYTAGTGIDITNDVISVDDTVITTGASGVYLPNSKFEIDTNGQAYKVIHAGGSSTETTTYNTDSQYIDYGQLVVVGNEFNVHTGDTITVNNLDSSCTSLKFLFIAGSVQWEVNNVAVTNNAATITADRDYVYTECVLTLYPETEVLSTNSETLTITHTDDTPAIKDEYITETSLASAISEIAIPVSGASGISVNDNVISLDNPVGLCAGDNITITVSGDSAIISGQEGGGSSYTAGTGIDITNNTISVDSDYVPFLTITNSQSTSQVTYGDLRALVNGTKKFNLYYRKGYGYGDFYYVSRAIKVGSHIELTFSTPNTNTEYDNYTDNLPNNKYRQYITAFVMDDTLDSTVAYVGDYNIEYHTVNIQPNWTETNTLAESYIRNKPDLSSFVTSTTVSAIAEAEVANVDTVSIDVCPILAGENVTITASGDSAVIDATIDTSTLATKTEVQTVSAAIPDTTGMVTYSGNTAINHIQLVSSLPASPDANTLYLIPEA